MHHCQEYNQALVRNLANVTRKMCVWMRLCVMFYVSISFSNKIEPKPSFVVVVAAGSAALCSLIRITIYALWPLDECTHKITFIFSFQLRVYVVCCVRCCAIQYIHTLTMKMPLDFGLPHGSLEMLGVQLQFQFTCMVVMWCVCDIHVSLSFLLGIASCVWQLAVSYNGTRYNFNFYWCFFHFFFSCVSYYCTHHTIGSHQRAWEYFIESIQRPSAFLATHCEPKSLVPTKNHTEIDCDKNISAYMGYNADTR